MPTVMKTKVLRPTNTQGARIKASANGFNVVIPFPDGDGVTPHYKAVQALIKKHNLNWDISTLNYGSDNDGYYFAFHYSTVTDNKIKPDDFTRIKNDVNGNPRYVLHYIKLANNSNGGYEEALNIARKHGGSKFHNKQYGGGIVFTEYSIRDLCESLNAEMGL